MNSSRVAYPAVFITWRAASLLQYCSPQAGELGLRVVFRGFSSTHPPRPHSSPVCSGRIIIARTYPSGLVITQLLILVRPLALHPRRDAEADFFGVALGIEGEEAGEDFVAEVGGPEQAALIGVVVLVGLVEEDRGGARCQVV